MGMYLDNLSFHHSKDTQKLLGTLKIPYVYNPSYTPAANPIEECFAIVKQQYKKERLNKIMNNTRYDNKDMIKKAFRVLNENLVRKLVKRADKFVAEY